MTELQLRRLLHAAQVELQLRGRLRASQAELPLRGWNLPLETIYTLVVVKVYVYYDGTSTAVGDTCRTGGTSTTVASTYQVG